MKEHDYKEALSPATWMRDWKVEHRVLMHAFMAVLQQEEYADAEKYPLASQYHKVAVPAVKSWLDKKPKKELTAAIKVADQALDEWYSAFGNEIVASGGRFEDVADPKVSSFVPRMATLLMMIPVIPREDMEWDLEVTIDSDDNIHGEGIEAVIETFAKIQSEKDLEEDDDDINDDDDWDEDKEVDLDTTYDWPMSRRVAFHAIADDLVRELLDRYPKLPDAKNYHLAAQRAIKTYDKFGTPQQRSIALDNADETLADLLDYLMPFRYDIPDVDEDDWRDVVYEAIRLLVDEIDNMYDWDINAHLKSIWYSKDDKEYFGDLISETSERLIEDACDNIIDEADEGEHNVGGRIYDTIDHTEMDKIEDDLLGYGDLTAFTSQPDSFIPAFAKRTISTDPQHYYQRKMSEFWKDIANHQGPLTEADFEAVALSLQDWLWYACHLDRELDEKECAIEIVLAILTEYGINLLRDPRFQERFEQEKNNDGEEEYDPKKDYWIRLTLYLEEAEQLLILFLEDQDFDYVQRVANKIQDLKIRSSVGKAGMVNLFIFSDYYNQRVDQNPY